MTGTAKLARGRLVLRLAALATTVLVAGTGCALSGDLVAYDLPPEEDTYTLEVVNENVTTVWTYRSAQPQSDDRPESQACPAAALGNPNAQPCRPEPLIFLRYDWNLALDNTAPAGKSHTVAVGWYYQERLSTSPTVTSLTAEVSFDSGATWRTAKVRKEPKGDTYTVTIDHPKRDAETVSLRVSAVDNQGNTVVQTLTDAYRLK